MRVESTTGVELRFAPDQAGVFSGYASLFGIRDRHGTVMRRGAFARSLAAHRAAGTAPLMLWMHDPTEPVGTWAEVREDERGLRVSGRLTLGTPGADKAYRLLRDKALRSLSVGFRTVRAAPQLDGTKHLEEVELLEISLVALPSLATALVDSVRSAPLPAAAGLAATIRRCAATLRSKP